MRRLLLAIVAGIVAAGAVGLFAHDPIKDFAFRACRSILPDDVGVVPARAVAAGGLQRRACPAGDHRGCPGRPPLAETESREHLPT
jgi:hypothetical protein